MEKNKNPNYILFSVALSCACIVFGVLCIYHTSIEFFARYALLFSFLIGGVFILICVLASIFSLKGKETATKTTLSLLVFLLFCLIVLFVLQSTGFFLVVQDETSLQNYLEKAGIWMPVAYVVLQYLQVVILPIPSVVSTLAGVALFGALKTVIFSFIGIWLGSVTAFFVGRKLGYKAVAWIVGKETLTKWRKKLKGKDNFVLTIMFFLPVFPDDLLCFVSGLSTMSNKFFFVMMSISRIVGITATCYSFEFIPFNTWWGILVWGIIVVGFIIAFAYLYKNLDKINAKFFKKTRQKSGEQHNIPLMNSKKKEK